LPWDSDYFGIPFYKIEGLFVLSGTTIIEKQKLLNRLLNRIVEKKFMVTCRIGMMDMEMISALQTMNFQIADALIVYTLDLEKRKTEKIIHTDLNNPDHESLIYRCIENMTDGRIISDPLIDKQLGLEFYVNATHHYLRNGADSIIYEHDGQQAGFAVGIPDSCISNQLGKKYGYLWLIIVEKKFRGLGIGQQLFKQFCSTFAKKCDILEIGTQINNIPANRLYLKSGAKYSTSLMTFHLWRR